MLAHHTGVRLLLAVVQSFVFESIPFTVEALSAYPAIIQEILQMDVVYVQQQITPIIRPVTASTAREILIVMLAGMDGVLIETPETLRAHSAVIFIVVSLEMGV